MPKLQPIQITERDLEEFIVKNPESVEEGFKVLSRQWPTDSGPLDILGVDAEGVITVVELKVVEDDKQIIQALRYYDFVSNYVAAIAHYFSNDKKFPITDQDPRLILIAPSFSQVLKTICKYLDIELDLKEYRAYKLPSGEVDLVINTVEIEERARSGIFNPNLEQKLGVIQDEQMRKLARKFIEELENVGFEKRMMHGEWVSLWHSGRRVATLGCKKKFFVIETKTEEGWKRFRVQSSEDYEKMMNLLKDKIHTL